jgi:hypothetical protein
LHYSVDILVYITCQKGFKAFFFSHRTQLFICSFVILRALDFNKLIGMDLIERKGEGKETYYQLKE